jgi:hypothetical protein
VPPAIVDAAIRHRAALLAREQAAVQAASVRWLAVERNLRAEIEALAMELALHPDRATRVQLLRMARYRALRAQVDDELRRYSAYMESRIVDGQRAMAAAALEHSAAMIDTAAAEAQVAVPFVKLPRAAIEEMIGVAGDGSPLRAVLDSASRGAGDALGDVLVRGVALGKSPLVVAQEAIRLGLGKSFTRMQAIARSEQLRAYRSATLASYQDSRIIDSYTRISARDGRVCSACLFADGRTYPIGYGFDAHVNCIVGGTVVSSPTILATSKRWYTGEVIEIQTINGNVLTVTSNHPILTDKGWIAAHLLQEGDNVISSLDGQRTIEAVNPNDHSRPTVIEDVLESFAGTGGMVALSVPSTRIDFHGDGMHGNVNIVRTGSFLGDWRQAAFGQPTGEQAFVGGGMGQSSFLADSAFAELLKGVFASKYSSMSSGGIRHSLFGGALRLHQSVGSGLPTDSNAGFEQAIPNYRAGSTISFGEHIFGDARQIEGNHFSDRDFYHIGGASFPRFTHRQLTAFDQTAKQTTPAQFGSEPLLGGVPFLGGVFDAHSGNVVIDCIFKISRRRFSGHVYNLQTKTGWYIAGGIITHNCRCSLIPRLRSAPAINYQNGAEWFIEQPELTQRTILGKGRYEAWSSGRASLDDMVRRHVDPIWGGSLIPTRVQDLPGLGG